VLTDSETGAYLAVRHLIDLGHRSIAILTGPATVSTAVDRVAGYRRALAEAGLGAESEQILFGEFNEASGYEMTRRVSLTAQPRPTAIFAGNNFIRLRRDPGASRGRHRGPGRHVDCRLRRPAPGAGSWTHS